MREILFRGKTIKQNNGVTTEKPIKENMWVYGNLTVGRIEGYKCDMISNKKEIYYINSETVGQFTGLTDKNGKKIFEGDIVRVKITQSEDIKTYGNCKYKVGFIVYNEDFALFTCKNNFMNFINWAFNDYEVIGNIHDNPELLQEQDK